MTMLISPCLPLLAENENSDGGSMIRLGVLFIAVALFAIWRTRLRAKSVENGLKPPVSRPGIAAQSQQKRLDDIEVSIFDYGREVEGRIETRLAMLDELMRQAERETDRLEELLERTELKKRQFEEPKDDPHDIVPLSTRSFAEIDADGPPLRFSRLQREMILTLYQTGFRPDEIARCMECTVSDIERVLELYGEGPSSQAA